MYKEIIKMKIGILVGSLRRESYSKKIATALKGVAPENVKFEDVDIDNLEMFNQDFDDDGTVPESWVKFRKSIESYDGFIFVTPEYNRSVPAVLKNALDIASRPWGCNVWNGKPAAVVSVSIGGLAGFGANHHLRQTLAFLNIQVMAQPEAYIGNVTALLDEKGNINNEDTKQYIQSIVDSFISFAEKLSNSVSY
jgi:chromate reductase